MGLTARGVWKTLFSWRTSPLPSHLFPPEPTSSPSRCLPGWGIQIFLFPLIFTPFPRCDAAGWGGSARWQRSREVCGATPSGEGAPTGAGCWVGGSWLHSPLCAEIPVFTWKTPIHGDPSSPRGRGRTRAWGWVFSGHPKNLFLHPCLCI